MSRKSTYDADYVYPAVLQSIKTVTVDCGTKFLIQTSQPTNFLVTPDHVDQTFMYYRGYKNADLAINLLHKIQLNLYFILVHVWPWNLAIVNILQLEYVTS